MRATQIKSQIKLTCGSFLIQIQLSQEKKVQNVETVIKNKNNFHKDCKEFNSSEHDTLCFVTLEESRRGSNKISKEGKNESDLNEILKEGNDKVALNEIQKQGIDTESRNIDTNASWSLTRFLYVRHESQYEKSENVDNANYISQKNEVVKAEQQPHTLICIQNH